MNKTDIHDFVASIDDYRISGIAVTSLRKEVIKQAGGKFRLFGKGNWSLTCHSEDELAKLIGILRDAGFAMVGGVSGWPPAAVFEDLRRKGKLAGEFTEMVWRSPTEPVVTKR